MNLLKQDTQADSQLSHTRIAINDVSLETQKILNTSEENNGLYWDYQELWITNIAPDKFKCILFGQTHDEFREFLQNEKYKKIFQNINNQNFDILFWENWLIKTKIHFEAFFYNVKIEEIEWFVCSENISTIFGRNGIWNHTNIDILLSDIRIISSIINIILSDNKKISLIFGKNRTINSLDDFQKLIHLKGKSKYFLEILTLPIDILILFFWNTLINDIDTLIILLNFENLDIFFQELKKDTAIEILKVMLKNPNIFWAKIEEIFENFLWSWILCYNNDFFKEYFWVLEKAYKNWFTYSELKSEGLEIIFPEGIHKQEKSKVWAELMMYLKQNPNTDIHQLMRELSVNYLHLQKIKPQPAWDTEIAIYLRYGKYDVDYPEISELITIFLQEAIKLWKIKWMKWIKILPRKIGYFPRKSILDENSRFINCIWDDFVAEMERSSIIFHLSNSDSFIPKTWQIAIISKWMKQFENTIQLWMELEESKDHKYFWKTKNKRMKDIFRELIRVIREINS